MDNPDSLRVQGTLRDFTVSGDASLMTDSQKHRILWLCRLAEVLHWPLTAANDRSSKPTP